MSCVQDQQNEKNKIKKCHNNIWNNSETKQKNEKQEHHSSSTSHLQVDDKNTGIS